MNDEFDRWVSDKPRFYTTSQMALMRNAFVAGQQAATEKLNTLPHRLMYESGVNEGMEQAANRIAELELSLKNRNTQFEELRTSHFTQIAELTDKGENLCCELGTAYMKIAELKADCKTMAESQVKQHRCTHDGEPEACLLDIGESCSYNNRFAGGCPEYGKCTCHACTIAAKYREGEK